MSSSASLPKRRPLAVAGFLTAGFLAVFFLPYGISVAPAISDSYVFGFNNRAALACFLVFAASFAYWSGGLGLVARTTERSPDSPGLSRPLLWVTLAITTAVTLSFWLAYRGIGAINEGGYLMDRLQHLAAGETVYRDFEFIYGPTVLYFPLALHRLLHLPLLDAYYLAWSLAWVGGIALLWLTVEWTCRTSPRKNGIYLLAFLGFIFSTVSLGLNYTPLRFAGAPFFAALTMRVLDTRHSVLPAVLTALGGATWVLFYSPEQGIAFVLGTFVFFLIFVDRRLPNYVPSVVLLACGEGLLALALWRTGVLHYMRGMAGGGYNLPLLPSLNTLVLLGLLLAAGCVLANSLRLHRRGSAVEYLILISLFALPAAFGRCDPGHIFMNTLGAFLAAWTIISYKPRAGRWMVWSYLASALFLPLALYQENNFFMFPVKVALLSTSDPNPALRRWTTQAMNRTVGGHRTAAMLAKWGKAFPVMVVSDVPPGRTMLAPLGYPSTLVSANSPGITNGRYRGLGNVMAPYEVEEKVAELRNRPDRLLLFTAGNRCSRTAPSLDPAPLTPEFDRAARRELLLNLQPLYLPHVRHTEALLAPVCAYIVGHYRPTSMVGPFAGSEVWERVPGR